MPSQHPGAPEEGPLKVGQTFIGQYEILAQIGSGGHAFVYRARHRFLGHLVALKALHRAAGVSLDMLRRGQAEAQIEFKLNHQGIVRVLDAGMSDDGLLYIVMEHLSGRSAREALQEYGRLTLRETLHLMRCVAEAMHVAHRAGVVHRDLKPENLFFTIEQVPKILDFGVAKIDDIAGWQTRKDSTVGTFVYMSPEQALGLPVSARSDIYACGLIFWELVIGKQPVMFQLGERRMGFHILSSIICKEPLPPLNAVDSSIPPYITELITQATAKAPEKRFASMVEFAAAIRECERLLDADEKRSGRVTAARDLSRKVPGSSGVAQVSSSSPPPDSDHDTVPASRPLFLGVLPSVRSPGVPAAVVPPQAPAAAPVSSPAPSSSEKPTMFSRTGAGNTAPLHGPSPVPRTAPGPASSPPATPKLASVVPPAAPAVTPIRARAEAASPQVRQSTPPAGPDSASLRQQRLSPAAAEEPIQVPLAGIGLVPLLWGLAAGILIFGLGAAYFLHWKSAAAPAASAAPPVVSAVPPPRSAPPPAPQPDEPVAPAPEATLLADPAPAASLAPPAAAPAPTQSPVVVAPKALSGSKTDRTKSGSVTQRDIAKMDERLRSFEANIEKKPKASTPPMPDSGLPPAPKRQSVF